MSHSRNSHRKYKISKRIYLQDTVCAHTCKLFHPSMQMIYVKWQVHHKKQGWLYFFPYMVICFLRDESTPCSETKSELSGTGVAGPQASPLATHGCLLPSTTQSLVDVNMECMQFEQDAKQSSFTLRYRFRISYGLILAERSFVFSSAVYSLTLSYRTHTN